MGSPMQKMWMTTPMTIIFMENGRHLNCVLENANRQVCLFYPRVDSLRCATYTGWRQLIGSGGVLFHPPEAVGLDERGTKGKAVKFGRGPATVIGRR